VSVNEEIGSLKDMADMIELSSREQKRASEDIMEGINNLSGSAQILANNSEDLNQVSQEIGGIATSIANISNGFRTK
jgi:methyl-accepting chemotaxis protein